VAKAYIGYTNKNGSIKSVVVEQGGEIDELGVQLNDYYPDMMMVKHLVRNSIYEIKDGDVDYTDPVDESSEDMNAYSEYDSKEDFIDEMEADCYYYLYWLNKWVVCKPNCNEFHDLETVIEEEF